MGYTGIGQGYLTGSGIWVTNNPLINKIENGMSKQQVIEALGKPLKENNKEWIYSYLFYNGYFYINFDENDKVKSKGYGC
jgi:outer membrane protein assembly factor BamE (lipoprotein component of BamABCDE complex)